MTDAYITMVERGVRKNPSIDLRRRLAKALKVTVGELVEEGGQMDVSREAVEQADVIIGINQANGVETVFYGKSLLTLISGGYEGPGGLRPTILRVPLDFNSEEPERLAAACRTLKGSTDAPTGNES